MEIVIKTKQEPELDKFFDLVREIPEEDTIAAFFFLQGFLFRSKKEILQHESYNQTS